MLLIHCPVCGMDRPELEFRNGGQGDIKRPDPNACDDDAWAAYLYLRHNPKGAYVERWRHTHGCGRFFTVRRDTSTDKFLPAEPEAAE